MKMTWTKKNVNCIQTDEKLLLFLHYLPTHWFLAMNNGGHSSRVRLDHRSTDKFSHVYCLLYIHETKTHCRWMKWNERECVEQATHNIATSLFWFEMNKLIVSKRMISWHVSLLHFYRLLRRIDSVLYWPHCIKPNYAFLLIPCECVNLWS